MDGRDAQTSSSSNFVTNLPYGYVFGTIPDPTAQQLETDTVRPRRCIRPVSSATKFKRPPQLFASMPPEHQGSQSADDFAKSMLSEMIVVELASSKARYLLHASVASARSGYFKQMLSSGFRESTEKKVVFSWTEPFEIAFRSVIQYLYHGSYTIGPESMHTITGATRAEEVQKLLAGHIYTYVLADRLIMSDLKALALTKAKDCIASGVKICLDQVRDLVNALYYDAIDAPEEAQGAEQKHSKDTATADEQPDLATFSKRASSECDSIAAIVTPSDRIAHRQDGDRAAETRKEINGMKDDPRRKMQETFAGFVHQQMADKHMDASITELVFEGGPFALDLFKLSSIASSRPSSEKRPTDSTSDGRA